MEVHSAKANFFLFQTESDGHHHYSELKEREVFFECDVWLLIGIQLNEV